MAAISVPTISGVQSGLQMYAFGAIARLGFNVISGFTGSGLIGGAIAAAAASAIIRGTQGDVIATMLGFQAAEEGLGGLLGGGGGGSGIFGGGGGGGGDGIIDM